jgi:hypothetical protein
MDITDRLLRSQVYALADEAFHQHLISGYGDGEYADQYQIVYQGKPRHLRLDQAQAFLSILISLNNHQAQV